MSKLVDKVLKKRASVWSAGAVGLPTALATYLIAKRLGANEYLAGGLGLGVGTGAGFGAHKLGKYLKAGGKPSMSVEQFKKEVKNKGNKPQILNQLRSAVEHDKAQAFDRFQTTLNSTGNISAAIAAAKSPSALDLLPKPKTQSSVLDILKTGR